jgi:ABC-type polysaccharide/polyol phosphate transport system ATPase subunit
MSDIILKLENISKHYNLGTYNHKKFFKIFKSFIFNKEDNSDRLISINRVNCEIQRGESVAILGKNGYGKSTLCKLISKVTEPSEGQIMIDGKLIPILDLNFGMELEQSGIENIRFLATLFGLQKNIIDSKISEITEFANLKDFLETPLKKYSNGMRTRLIFSTLIFFPSDIFILDEVLAVSDKSFKNKAIKQIQKINSKGTSILCISHEESIIKSLCEYGYVFTDKGVLSEKLKINDAIELYNATLKKI